jgi:hypothetical protein
MTGTRAAAATPVSPSFVTGMVSIPSTTGISMSIRIIENISSRVLD